VTNVSLKLCMFAAMGRTQLQQAETKKRDRNGDIKSEQRQFANERTERRSITESHNPSKNDTVSTDSALLVGDMADYFTTQLLMSPVRSSSPNLSGMRRRCQHYRNPRTQPHQYSLMSWIVSASMPCLSWKQTISITPQAIMPRHHLLDSTQPSCLQVHCQTRFLR